MPTLKDLTATLKLLTGAPTFTIEGTVDELANAGYLPNTPSNTVSYLDAANLIVALAIGRSPSEAAELLSDYARMPASNIEGQFEDAPDKQLGAAEIAELARHTSKFDSPMLLIADLLEQAEDAEALILAAEITRGPSFKCATFIHCLTENGRPTRRFIEFAPPTPPGGCPWGVTTKIGERIFTEVARLFHGSSQAPTVTHDALTRVQ